MTVFRVFFIGVRALAVTAMVLAGIGSQAEARRYAAIVVDHRSGEVLHSRKADTLVYPASLTKMMTLLMLFEALDRGKFQLNSKLRVSRRAAGMPASRLGLKSGSSIKVEDAIRALATKSANDVAVVVAEALGGTEIKFAVKMTKRARAIGMRKTTFKNASGLPNRHQKSTARDMATLARHLIRHHADRYHYFGESRFRYKGRTYRSHNRLMDRYPGMDGLKTGYIRASGYNLAASAKRGRERLITIVFGGRTSRTRDAEVERLMNLGFARISEKRARLVALGPPQQKPQIGRAEPDLVADATAQTLPAETSVPLATAAATTVSASNTESALALADSVSAGSMAAGGTELPVVHAPVGDDMDLLVPAPKPGMRLRQGQPKALAAGKFGVQVGAYYDPDKARRAAYSVAQKLPRLLLKGNIDVSALRSGRRAVFRARLVGFSRLEAERACQLLRRQDQDCLVLRTGSLQLAAR